MNKNTICLYCKNLINSRNGRKFCNHKCNRLYNYHFVEGVKERDKIYMKEYIKNWSLNNPDKIKEYKGKYKYNFKEYNKDWRLKNPEKYKKLLKKKHENQKKDKIRNNAWKNDYSKKDDKCFLCGNNINLQFHHTNYQEHKGITLCFDCHRKLHLIKRNYERGLLINN